MEQPDDRDLPLGGDGSRSPLRGASSRGGSGSTNAGAVYTEDVLELGPDGVIEGEADVARAIISGEVRGRIRVRERLLLEASGRIHGLLDAGRVEIRPGAQISGEVRISGEVGE